MKLIDSINFEYDLSTAQGRLRDHGILASTTDEFIIAPRYSHMARSSNSGIWVHLDEQYNDAVMLLKNSEHQVTSGLTEEQMQELEVLAKNSFYSATESFFGNLATLSHKLEIDV